jgi:hypothetical protein
VLQEVIDRSSYGYGWLLVYLTSSAWVDKVNLDFWANIPRENQDPLSPIMVASYNKPGLISVVKCDVKGSFCSKFTIAFTMCGLIPKLKIFDAPHLE